MFSFLDIVAGDQGDSMSIFIHKRCLFQKFRIKEITLNKKYISFPVINRCATANIHCFTDFQRPERVFASVFCPPLAAFLAKLCGHPAAASTLSCVLFLFLLSSIFFRRSRVRPPLG